MNILWYHFFFIYTEDDGGKQNGKVTTMDWCYHVTEGSCSA